jgi:hypothetical protein
MSYPKTPDPGSPISLNDIHSVFGKGNEPASNGYELDNYNNITYWDSFFPYNRGVFSASQLQLSDFYSKHAYDPILPGVFNDNTPGTNKTFIVQPFRTFLLVEMWGAGGGGGGGGYNFSLPGVSGTSSILSGFMEAGGGTRGTSGVRRGNQSGQPGVGGAATFYSVPSGATTSSVSTGATSVTIEEKEWVEDFTFFPPDENTGRSGSTGPLNDGQGPIYFLNPPDPYTFSNGERIFVREDMSPDFNGFYRAYLLRATTTVTNVTGTMDGKFGNVGAGQGAEGGNAPFGGSGGLRGGSRLPQGNKGSPGNTPGGGGGSGGYSDFSSSPSRAVGGSGGAGAYASIRFRRPNLSYGQILTYTVGAGGAGSPWTGENGWQNVLGGKGGDGAVKFTWE